VFEKVHHRMHRDWPRRSLMLCKRRSMVRSAAPYSGDVIPFATAIDSACSMPNRRFPMRRLSSKSCCSGVNVLPYLPFPVNHTEKREGNDSRV
jgi:hypothetical protein